MSSSEEQAAEAGFNELIRHIQERRGIDFRGYKPTSLRRRIQLRMSEVGIDDFGTYHAFLEAHPEEFTALLNRILINVSSFFRDPDAWAVLREQVVPRILGRPAEHRIRIWSAGCASGQEPYSLAMLFAEAMGVTEFCNRVKIYATDLDEAELITARHAAYTIRDVESVPPDLLDKYFEHTNAHYIFQRELRKCVIFGRHNVVFDAPISRIDLLTCRNLLIYLEAETQEFVLPRLHYALAEEGYLFLGKAETQLARSKLFEPVEAKHRIFRKLRQEWRRAGGLGFASPVRDYEMLAPARMMEAVMEQTSGAHLVVNLSGTLTLANAAARRMLDIHEADIGNSFHDLPISYRPAELRGQIETAHREGRAVRVDHLEYLRPQAVPIRVTIELAPLTRNGQLLGTLLTFSDTTLVFALQQELEAAQENLETTIEELQATNEELETTNEELQSSNEELETTNEELQSTNEELETMNEELRSTNEELESANEELRRQSEDSMDFRLYSDSVLRSINAGIVVFDDALRVRSWNRWNENVWGLREEEALGQSLQNLDIGLPVHRLEEPADRVLAGEQEPDQIVLNAVDRRGRQLLCRIRLAPLLYLDRSVRGMVMIIEDVTELSHKDEFARYLGRVLGESLNEIYFLHPATLNFQLVNRGAEEKLGYTLGTLKQISLADLMPRLPRVRLDELIAPLLSGEQSEVVFETVLRSRSGREYPAEICLQYYPTEEPPILLAIVHDTTERKTEAELESGRKEV